MTRLAEVLILGASLGALYALMGASVTVVYQAVRVPNVAFIGIGTAAAVLHWDLVGSGGRIGSGLSWWGALVPALGLAVVLGLVTDLLVRRFAGSAGPDGGGEQPATVPAMLLLLGWTAVLLGGTTLVFGTRPKLLPAIWGGPPLHTGTLSLQRQQMAALLIGSLACLALFTLYQRTRFGLALRASAADIDGAKMVGVDTRNLSRGAWALSSVLAALAVILVAYPVMSNTYEQAVYLPFAFGAALLGGLRSVPLAVGGGFALGIIPTLLEPSDTWVRIGGARNLIAFGLIALLMIRRPRVLARLAEGERGTAAPLISPLVSGRGTGLLVVPTRLRRLAFLIVAAGMAVAVPAFSDDVALTAWTHGVSVFLVCASIVTVSGWCGELPLGQVAFSGVGAYMAANLAVRLDLPHVMAIPLAALCAVPFALLAGIPAFRSRGRLPFAIASVGLMVVGSSFLWGPRGRWFTGEKVQLERPEWMEALNGRPTVSLYLLALVLAAGVVWFSLNLRSSRVGRAFAAIRDAERGARSLGIDPARYRMVALAFSAFVAALGGVIHAYLAGSLDPARFAAFLSVQYLLYTVIGGAGSLAGVAVVVWAFEVAPDLGGGTAGLGPGAIVALGALAMATSQLVPGGLGGLARRVAGAVLPMRWSTPGPIPALIGPGLTELDFDEAAFGARFPAVPGSGSLGPVEERIDELDFGDIDFDSLEFPDFGPGPGSPDPPASPGEPDGGSPGGPGRG